MNLSEITTPDQLMQMNETPAVSVEQALDVISEFNPAQTKALAMNLVEQLRKFHVRVSLKDGIDNPQAWACDAGILAVALNCLDQVEI
jgi:hypothetical protein